MFNGLSAFKSLSARRANRQHDPKNNTRSDRGMTLPEVLISVAVTGMLVASMAMATTVILRQVDNSRGRINNSRSEQSIGIWMPADLASAEVVNTDAGASPCGASCPANVNVSGTNALMLTWTGSIAGTTTPIPTQTIVSYRYIQTATLEWQVIRVSCYSVDSAAPTCSQVVVLHDVSGPPPGIEYYAGVTPPVWVMLVTLATDPAAPGDGTEAGGDPTYYVKNGRRVTVTINGGGDLAGAGGGGDSVTLSAGGTNRETELGTTNLTGAPTFSATRSRCGGNFGLVIDTSGSISSNISYVRTGVAAFIDAFAGTPIKLQVVTFATTATTLGAGAAWTKYYDMLVESDVTALKSLVAGLNSTGGTNWEDGMFRMFRNSDGTVQAALPGTMIFFTDGFPTYSRFNSTSASSPPVAHADDSGLPNGTGSSYSQLSWNRANRVAREFEVDLERMIGVYVGNDVNGQSLWVQQGAGYHLENFVRAYHLEYQRGSHAANWERGYSLNYQRSNNGMSYEKKVGNNWNSTSRSSYENNNDVPGDSDGWRARVTGTLGNWKSTSEQNFNNSNLNPPNTDADGFRAVKDYNDGYDFWESVTESEYNSNNTNSNESDGWRATTVYSAPFTTWATVTASQYNAGNTTPDESDSWRELKNYTSPWSVWEATTEAIYNAGNTSTGTSDGYDATKAYTEPFTFHEGSASYYRPNRDILKQFVAPSGAVPAVQSGGVYTNSAQATYYELPNWNQFADAMTSMALAECGGTVTLQTKIGATNASDPFTYQNSIDLTTATTSALYRSGTFDYELSSGVAVTATISPMETSTLSDYNPGAWTCKAGGVNYPFTTAPIAVGSPWTKITLSVAPNTAISCVLAVALK
ncbi:hypothetical protein BH10ACT2_BH10ACT2_21940 [soil metagenome]